MTIGDRIKERRDTLNISQETLANMTGLSKNSIFLYEKGDRIPTADNLKKIANMLGTTTAYLVGDSKTPRPIVNHNLSKSEQLEYALGSVEDDLDVSIWDIYNSSKKLIKEYDPEGYKEEFGTETPNAHSIDNVVQVPVIDGVISVSAGDGNDYPNITWNEVGTMPIPKDDLIGYSWQGAQYRIISVDGDSMEPYICNGDKLLFASGIDVGPGEVAVVSYNDRLWVKGILENKDGTITLISFNKNYPDRIIDPQQHDFHILGKALRVVSSKKIPSTI